MKNTDFSITQVKDVETFPEAFGISKKRGHELAEIASNVIAKSLSGMNEIATEMQMVEYLSRQAKTKNSHY